MISGSHVHVHLYMHININKCTHIGIHIHTQGVQGYPQLQRQFEVSLSYLIPCFTKQNKYPQEGPRICMPSLTYHLHPSLVPFVNHTASPQRSAHPSALLQPAASPGCHLSCPKGCVPRWANQSSLGPCVGRQVGKVSPDTGFSGPPSSVQPPMVASIRTGLDF